MQRHEFGILRDADHDSFRARNFLPFVVPVFRWREHIFADAFARCRIFQPLHQFSRTTLVRPCRNERRKIVVPRGVSISVSGNISTRGASRIDLGDNLGHASPIIFPGNFNVPDLHRDAGFAADAQRLVDGVEHRIAFVAHVRRINAPELSGFGGERDQLLCLSVRSRSIFQRRGNANRAVFHGVAHQRLHLFELFSRGLLVFFSEHDCADGCRAHVTRKVNAHALFFQPRKILAEGPPVRRDFVVVVTRASTLDERISERRNRIAFARDLSRYPLINFRGKTRVDQNRHFRLAEQVDETGRNHFASRINRALAGRGCEIADGRDSPVADADVTRIPGRTSPVDDVAVGDDEVEAGRWRHRLRQQRTTACEQNQPEHCTMQSEIRFHFCLSLVPSHTSATHQFPTAAFFRRQAAPSTIHIPSASHS